MKKIKIKRAFLYLYSMAIFFTSERFSLAQVGGFSFQIHHLVFLFMLISMLSELGRRAWELYIPNKLITLFVIYMIVCSLFNAPRFGVGGLIINAVYAYGVILVCYNLFYKEDKERIIQILGYAGMTMYIMILVNLTVHYRVILNFFAHPYGHPALKLFVGGGHGIEATLIAMFSLFLLKRKEGVLYCIANIIISVLYASRTGVLIGLLVFVYYMIIIRGIRIKTILKIGIPVVILGIVTINSSAGAYLLERFRNTGVEIGSATRMSIWECAIDVFKRHPFGVGCGNVIKVINNEVRTNFGESNLHNIYLQYAVDEGIIGLFFIVTAFIYCVKDNIKSRFTDEFGIYMLLYLFQGLFQSRGVDSWMAIGLGLYLVSVKMKNKQTIFIYSSKDKVYSHSMSNKFVLKT